MGTNSCLMEKPKIGEYGTFKSYILGFLLSILLTVVAYLAVAEHLIDGWLLVFTLIGLGIIQASIQLILFLHLGKESRPQWNLLVFLFMAMVLIILVCGSLWIMNNLNYHNMPSMEKEESKILHQEEY
jgi:cytochrome o ubiquinol oxidase subunit IV